jgi:hypothetical protein
MEIAIQKLDNRYTIYVEGVSWHSMTNYFKNEAVNIYSLVYIIYGRRITHDKNVDTGDDRLSFLKQNLPVEQILALTGEMELVEPFECKLGNAKFFIERLFRDAYQITFKLKSEAQKFTSVLASNFSDLQEALENEMSYSTDGFTDDFIKSKNFERFLDRRLERWRQEVVSNYDQLAKRVHI